MHALSNICLLHTHVKLKNMIGKRQENQGTIMTRQSRDTDKNFFSKKYTCMLYQIML
jgi:hypothetical protein